MKRNNLENSEHLLTKQKFNPNAEKHFNSGDKLVRMSHSSLQFVLGGTSSMMAVCITNPIDVVKVRMQLEGELASSRQAGMLSVNDGYMLRTSNIVQTEGLSGLYKGLSAACMRAGSYSACRLGLYDPAKEALGATDPAKTPLWKKIAAGAVAGSISSAISNPTDLVTEECTGGCAVFLLLNYIHLISRLKFSYRQMW